MHERPALNLLSSARRPPPTSHRKHSLGTKNMDIERINTIGSTLADLTARTAALRGYL